MTIKNLSNLARQRYERKFFFSTLSRNHIEIIIKRHPMQFCEVYPQRLVNNIYLDTVGMDNYFDNVEGLSKRIKVRIRWYGNLMGTVEKPTLELKIKNNMLGTKLSYHLTKLNIDKELSKSKINNMFEASDIPLYILLYLKSLNLTLMNQYSRKYYRSIDGKYRITVDSNLGYYKLSQLNNTFSHRIVNKGEIIVELKYDKDHDEQAKNVTRHFPFRISKNSKYVEGVKRLRIC